MDQFSEWAVEQVTLDGKVYGIPSSIGAGRVANADLLAQAGVTIGGRRLGPRGARRGGPGPLEVGRRRAAASSATTEAARVLPAVGGLQGRFAALG